MAIITNPLFPASGLRQGFDRQAGPSHWLFQGHPAESKLLARLRLKDQRPDKNLTQTAQLFRFKDFNSNKEARDIRPPTSSFQLFFRSPCPDTGHRTPDTGHRTPDTGHRTPDTGHRTPDLRG
jgi:hypothetical protein